MCNRYPDIKLLAHKDVFARSMQFCQELDGEGFDFIPPTFRFPDPHDQARFAEYQRAHPNATFIAKPQVGAQGDSISLFKQLRELPYALENKDIIVQRYLDKPLLLDGIKFDLRVYVVVVGFNPVQAFLYDEGLARFCTVSKPIQYSRFGPNSFSFAACRRATKHQPSQTTRKHSCT